MGLKSIAGPQSKKSWIAEQLESELFLQEVVETFGCEVVWRTGLDLLGYPPSWDVPIEKVVDLKRKLENEKL